MFKLVVHHDDGTVPRQWFEVHRLPLALAVVGPGLRVGAQPGVTQPLHEYNQLAEPRKLGVWIPLAFSSGTVGRVKSRSVFDE